MIEKLLPRVLNSSSDNRLKKKTEMNDALNIVVTEDFEDFNSADDTGNEGVIKPVKGNVHQQKVPETLFTVGGGRRVIGSVSDVKTGVVFFFVYSTVVEEHGVYAYDTQNYFGEGADVYLRVYSTSEFNFQSNGVVQGTVVHVAGEAGGFRPMLYFTDNVNEPRKLDVLRAREDNPYQFDTLQADRKDFITACPKTPMHPIVFEFGTDPSRAISDFRDTEGFQFAFQCIYRSGEESALSTYSDIAIPPQYLQYTSASPPHSVANVCRLQINPEVFGAPNFTDETESVRILARRGNTGAFFVIEEIDNLGTNNVISYRFYNDQVVTGITTEEEQKQFDSLPRVAEAVAVVEDRLFYGNYIEGFDEPTIQAQLTVQYQQRPTDLLFVDIEVNSTLITLDPDSTDLQATQLAQRVTGMTIDTSEVPNNLPANTSIGFEVTFNPGQSFDLYDATNSYHLNRLTDPSTSQTAAATLATDIAGDTTVDRAMLFARNGGVGTSNLRWKNTEHPGAQQPGSRRVTIGSSPTSALKFSGQPVTFSCNFKIVEAIDDGPAFVLNAIVQYLTGGGVITVDNTELNDLDFAPSYTYNLGFLDPDAQELDPESQDDINLSNLSLDGTKARAATAAILPREGGLDNARLIFPISDDEDQTSTSDFQPLFKPPTGYAIVNQANLSFNLVDFPHLFADDPSKTAVALEIADVSALDVRSCIPVITADKLKLRGYRVFSAEYLESHNILDVVEDGEEVEPGLLSYVLHNLSGTETVGGENIYDQEVSGERRRVVGYLHSAGQTGLDSTDLLTTNAARREAVQQFQQNNPAVPLNPIAVSTAGISMVDGEAGLQVLEKKVELVEQFSGGAFGSSSTNVIGITLNPVHDESEAVDIGCFGFEQIFGGLAVFKKYLLGSSTNQFHHFVQELPHPNSFISEGVQLGAGGRTISKARCQNFVDTLDAETGETLETTLSFAGASDQAELSSVRTAIETFFAEGESSGDYRSFKTNANHDFGVVYYDERGRSGVVNRLGSVFVGGYNPSDGASANSPGRQGNAGRVEVEIQLGHAPPPWAHNYQIVYAGNSSVRDFIQFSTAGAFFAIDGESVENDNIYVSLNYLQGHPTTSYTSGYGAKANDGTQNLYVYSPGDFLRVLSYYSTDTLANYPSNLIFEIVDVVTLGSDSDQNPLVPDGLDVPEHLQGQFLVLKDNIQGLSRFSHADVVDGANAATTSEHVWNNRCIVEIISPRRATDPEDRVYHEISEVYNVGVNDDGELVHQAPVVTVSRGDVWWRQVPVNITEFNTVDATFQHLIEETDGSPIGPRFRPYYLETDRFNDTIVNSEVNGFGKRKFVSTLRNEVRRFSSVTFSDKNDYSTKRLRFTSFNAFNAPFKDLPNEHGSINALLNYSDSLFVVQQDKASAIPVSRNVLSDALGQDTLISTNKILGDQVFYAGAYGCDNNPESVIKVDTNVYFAHKSRGEVYRFNPSNGLQVISRKGMNSFFRDAFEDVINDGAEIRIVSGYDPLKDEYLISIVNVQSIPQTEDLQYVQPLLELISAEAEIEVDFPSDTGGDIPEVDPEDDVPEDTEDETTEVEEPGSPAVEGLFEQQLLATYSMRQVFNVPLSIRIRHSFTEAEQDIGFGQDGYVDPADIQAFIDAEGVGPSAIQVITWYDQTGGGNDAYQTNPLRAPLVATEDGIVYGANGRVAILFDVHANLGSSGKKNLINNLNTTFVNRDFFFAWERSHAGSEYNDPSHPNPFFGGGNMGTLTSHSNIPPLVADAENPTQETVYQRGHIEVHRDSVYVYAVTPTQAIAYFGEDVPEARSDFAAAMGPALVNVHVSADGTDKSASINQHSADLTGPINANTNFNFGIGMAGIASSNYGVLGFMQEVRLYESLPPVPRNTIKDEMNAAWDLYTDPSDTTDNIEDAT